METKLVSDWKNIQYRFYNDTFTITDTKEHICMSIIPMKISDIERVKKRLTTFKDQRSRPGNLKEAREMVERMGIRFGVTGWALPGFKDDTIYEDEEDE